jgi:hypothetical protein
MTTYPVEPFAGMRDVSAHCVPVQVVSAKLSGEWIIRAIGPFRDVPTLRSWIEPFTKMAPRAAVIEWTFHKYRIPAYLVYGFGQVEGLGWPQPGVWIFRKVGDPPDERSTVYDDVEWLRGPS